MCPPTCTLSAHRSSHPAWLDSWLRQWQSHTSLWRVMTCPRNSEDEEKWGKHLGHIRDMPRPSQKHLIYQISHQIYSIFKYHCILRLFLDMMDTRSKQIRMKQSTAYIQTGKDTLELTNGMTRNLPSSVESEVLPSFRPSIYAVHHCITIWTRYEYQSEALWIFGVFSGVLRGSF